MQSLSPYTFVIFTNVCDICVNFLGKMILPIDDWMNERIKVVQNKTIYNSDLPTTGSFK